MLGPYTFIIAIVVCMGCISNFAMCWQHVMSERKARGIARFLEEPDAMLQIGMGGGEGEKAKTGQGKTPRRTSMRGKTMKPPSEKETSRLVRHPPTSARLDPKSTVTDAMAL